MSQDHYFLHGDDVHFDINTGDDATPAWVAMDNAEEPSADLSKNQTTRKPRKIKYELTRGGKFSNAFSFKYSPVSRPDVASDAVFDKLWDSFINGKPVQLAMTSDGMASNDSFGFKAWCEIMKMPLPGTAEEGVMLDIEAKPTDYVESGALVSPDFITPAAGS